MSKDVMAEAMKGLDRAEKALWKELRKGAAIAGMQWIDDAVNKQPSVPLKEGTLRGSGSVHVKGKYIGGIKGEKDGTPNLGNVPHPKVLLTVGFNTPYAARQHEGVSFNFTEPGSGAKFLSSKKTMYEKQYIKIMLRPVVKRFK